MIQHLVNVSGGKDSTATYLRALELGRPFRAVFADTGHEHEWTYEFVDRLADRTGGPKVEIVRADFARQMAGKREYIAKHWPKEGISPEIVQAANRIGMKTATRETLMETTVKPISLAPCSAACNGTMPCSRWRVMFSTTTMASSTTKPVAMVNAIRDKLSML